ncbi:hypothetical protein GGR56DRAFT_221807 [Xylariaceae sp. FL0804]|nr:hypothetical protein GGR56DRAFT_221807 [Xylariaceae sp. FL0804]
MDIEGRMRLPRRYFEGRLCRRRGHSRLLLPSTALDASRDDISEHVSLLSQLAIAGSRKRLSVAGCPSTNVPKYRLRISDLLPPPRRAGLSRHARDASRAHYRQRLDSSRDGLKRLVHKEHTTSCLETNHMYIVFSRRKSAVGGGGGGGGGRSNEMRNSAAVGRDAWLNPRASPQQEAKKTSGSTKLKIREQGDKRTTGKRKEQVNAEETCVSLSLRVPLYRVV